jgi:predicted DNA-binding transcriptional regulator YafY
VGGAEAGPERLFNMKADRLVSILLLLQSAPRRTARELAATLEVSERTIYRDVDALSVSGVPVLTERGAVGGISLSEGYRRAIMHFGEEEIRALFSSGSAVLADLGLSANLERALEKLRGGLSDVQRRAAEKARGRIHVDQRRWNQSDPPVEKLALLRRAVWDDRRVEITYEDRLRTVTTRPVDPYGLVSKAGVWYVIAQTAEGFRSFRVDRIRSARELDERFDRAPDFDLDAHWREATAQMRAQQQRFPVTLRVSPEAMEMVCSYWPTERVDEHDESLLRVIFSSEDAAVFHLMGWSDGTEIVEPQSLCAAIVARAQAILEKYSVTA